MGKDKNKLPPILKLVWSVILVLSVILLSIFLLTPGGLASDFKAVVFGNGHTQVEFNASRAYQDVVYQVGLGPRIPGSEPHQKTQDWILAELEEAGWDTEIQDTSFQGQQIRNIIGKSGDGEPWIVLGAHYDTRIYADLDPDPNKILDPVPGANDGASGVAVLLEVARQLQVYFQRDQDNSPWLNGSIWLVFFDAEDNGRIEGWDWIMGSRAFVANLKSKPDAAVIIDMVGDKSLKIYQEENSDDQLNQEIWGIAGELGYADIFIPFEKYAILDDHTAFLEAGIPAVDIIDFEYAYWHTTADTPEQVSPESLEIVGRTLLTWLLKK